MTHSPALHYVMSSTLEELEARAALLLELAMAHPDGEFSDLFDEYVWMKDEVRLRKTGHSHMYFIGPVAPYRHPSTYSVLPFIR